MTVRETIEAHVADFTATERRISTTILLDYPFSGLVPAQELTEKARTSASSMSRFVKKIGFQDFQDFQHCLTDELRQMRFSPIERKKMSTPVNGAYLKNFLGRIEALLKEATATVSEAQFTRICGMLADTRRAVYFIGGRMSDTLLQYMSRLLRQLREKVYNLSPDPEVWPEYLLRMRPRDILFVADFRRYQANLATLAGKAVRDRKASVILMTDRWMSPVSRNASEIIALPTNSNTLWNSCSGAFAVIEAILTNIAEANWGSARQRIEHWDALRLDSGEE